MERSYEVFKRAIECVGPKKVASELHLSSSLIYKWCRDSRISEGDFAARGAANPFDRIRKLYEATKDTEIVNWVCQIADGFYVKNIETPAIPTGQELVESTQRLIKEFAETLTAVSRSYADASISAKEAGVIRKEWEDLKRVGESLVRACEAGTFNVSH